MRGARALVAAAALAALLLWGARARLSEPASWTDDDCAVVRAAWGDLLARSPPSDPFEALVAMAVALAGPGGVAAKGAVLAARLGGALAAAAIAARCAPHPFPLLAGLAVALSAPGVSLPWREGTRVLISGHLDLAAEPLAVPLAVLLGATAFDWVVRGARPLRAAASLALLSALALSNGIAVPALLVALSLALPWVEGPARRRLVASLAVLSLSWIPAAALGLAPPAPPDLPGPRASVGAPREVLANLSYLTSVQTGALSALVLAAEAALLLACLGSASARRDRTSLLFALYALSFVGLSTLGPGSPTATYAVLALGAAVGAGRSRSRGLGCAAIALLSSLSLATILGLASREARVPPLPSCEGAGTLLPWTWSPLDPAVPAWEVMGEDGTRPLRALRHGLRAGALGADGGLPSGACGGAKGEELEHCLVGAAHAALLGRGGDACASWLPVERPACLESLGFWGVASAPDLGAGVAAAASACAGAEERVEGGAASCARGAGLAAGWAADGAVGLIASECRSMGPQLGEGCLAGAASVVGRYQRARGGYACDELEGAAGAACRASAGAARSGR